MKLGAAPLGSVATRVRHKSWKWCRRPNGFTDMPLWRAIAKQTSLPLTTVQAFVNRLEEFANAAGQRGHVGDFSAHEFAAAHDITTEEATRIFACLEQHGWIDQEHIADFYTRNPDHEDTTAAERMRRMRRRKNAMKEFARMAALGLITAAERTARELALAELCNQARDGLLPESGFTARLHHLLDPRSDLSTVTARYGVTPVTVTPEQIRDRTLPHVDNSGGEASSSAAGQQGDQTAAELWLMSTGTQLLTERLHVLTTVASMLIQRWRRDLQDDEALMKIVVAADRLGKLGEEFKTFIANQVSQAIKERRAVTSKGEALPFPPVPVKRR